MEKEAYEYLMAVREEANKIDNLMECTDLWQNNIESQEEESSVEIAQEDENEDE